MQQKTYPDIEHSIKAILTAAKGIDLNHSKQLIPYMFYVPANDH